MSYPPYQLTPHSLKMLLAIQEILGELKASMLTKPSLKLRRKNKINTIRHSLAIEGNDLDLEMVTALVDKKRVLGPLTQVKEVMNAAKVYDDLTKLNPYSQKDFLKVHGLLMTGLIESAGNYRDKNVGVFKGQKIGHVAPQARRVPDLMKELFDFLNNKDEIPLLIKACVFHYELEFIHPFEDGNGRMGRLWQQLILMRHSPLFEYVSVESLIHQKQMSYYQVLEKCDKLGDSTAFLEFSLELILETLEEFKGTFRPKTLTYSDRIQLAHDHFKKTKFNRKDYLNLNKKISTATASRDLAQGVDEGILIKTGDKALASYKFKP